MIVLNQVDNDQIVKTSTRFVGEGARQVEKQKKEWEVSGKRRGEEREKGLPNRGRGG